MQISKVWKLDDPASYGAIVSMPRLPDIVRFLRGMPAEEVAARQAGVVANRLKFYYPGASAAAIAASTAAADAATGTAVGGAAGSGLLHSNSLLEQAAAASGQPVADLQQKARQAEPAPVPGASVLGELLMRKMCRRAAAVQKRLEEAARQGMDIADSDEKIEHPTLALQNAVADEQQQPAEQAVVAQEQRRAAKEEGGEQQPEQVASAQRKSKKKRARASQKKKRHLL